MKKILSVFILFVFIFSFSLSYFSFNAAINKDGGDEDIHISDEDDDSEDIYEGSNEDTYLNTFWYGKVDSYQGNFGISI